MQVYCKYHKTKHFSQLLVYTIPSHQSHVLIYCTYWKTKNLTHSFVFQDYLLHALYNKTTFPSYQSPGTVLLLKQNAFPTYQSFLLTYVLIVKQNTFSRHQSFGLFNVLSVKRIHFQFIRLLC